MSLASRAFRFGVNMLAVDSGASWQRRAQHVEELGFDVLLVPDHLGIPSPWPALATAAAATERLRVGPFVLNAAFTNPTLLARDVATVDQLSHGRVELGLGTGYVKEEFESAGIEFLPAGRRVDHLGDTVARTMSLLTDPDHTPRPVQERVPLLLGGTATACSGWPPSTPTSSGSPRHARVATATSSRCRRTTSPNASHSPGPRPATAPGPSSGTC
ncbi:LLM class flavin-dependent oxidoreductase [Gordonia amicalis]